MRAMTRWIRADLRAGAVRAVVVAAVAAGVVTALLLSAGLLQGATNPWQGLFNASRGAQIWLHLSPGTSISRLRSQVSGIEAIAGPYRATAATVTQDGQHTRVELRAMEPQLPAIGRPLLVSGRWLTAGSLTGVVLEATFAQAIDARTGDVLVLDNVDGTSSVRVRVTGIAQTADQGFYPDQTPGLIWVLPGLLRQIEPNAGHIEEVVGLRLANPAATGVVAQQVVTQLGNSAVGSISTWQQVKQSMARGDPLLGLLLALFGLMALGAAVLAIVNVTSGRVLLQKADLGMLKTLGFTPVQVMIMLTAEHAVLTCCGITVGLIASRLLMPVLLGSVPGVSTAAATVPAGWAAVIAGGCFAAVLLATAAPAWQAGRVQPVAAVRTTLPHGHLSRIARVAMAARIPPALVLGARSAFVRRLPAALTVSGLALPVMMITVGLGFWSTLDDVQHHPADIGLAAQVTVSPGALTAAQAVRLIDSDPQVLKTYSCVLANALVPGETSTITTLGMGTSRRPYPFHVVQGRLYHAPEQAVATAALLSSLGLRVGQFVRMWFGGVPVTFQIVGRIIDPQYGGQVLAYGRDTLADEGAAAPVGFYSLILRPGVTPAAAVGYLSRASGGRLSVAVVADPADQLGIVRGAVAALIAVLAVIGLTSLLTTSVLGYRDQLRDVSVLRAMGLTPLQVRAARMTRTTVLALIAVAIGGAAGRVVSATLISAVSKLYGIGAGLGTPPSATTLTALVVLAVCAAAVTGVLPFRPPGRLPAVTILGP